MHKLFASFFMALSLLLTPVQKSEAAVGLIAAPAIVVVGGIVAATGGLVVVDAMAEAVCARVLDNAHGMGCFFTGMLGVATAAIGLLILDGDQELAFGEANSSMKHLKGVSQEEIAVYNSELDQLNAINSEITAEVKADKSVDAESRWNEMRDLLSPATLKIAGLNGEALLKSLK